MTMINVDLEEARRIKYVILKNLHTSSEMVEKGPGKVNMFYLDMREDEVRLVPERDFEVVKLNDNHSQ